MAVWHFDGRMPADSIARPARPVSLPGGGGARIVTVPGGGGARIVTVPGGGGARIVGRSTGQVD